MRKPRVMTALATRGDGRTVAIESHSAIPTAGGVEVITGRSQGSLLTYVCNTLWAAALTHARAGRLEYFLLHHDDIEIKTPRWLDIMVAEMNRVGAAILSVIQPIKNDSGDSSTAIEHDDPWKPHRLSMAECWELPATFGQADLPAGRLLVNTGLMLVDLRRPEFGDTHDRIADFTFTIEDRIVLTDEGNYVAQVKSEDWNFSRMCHDRGLPVFATRKIDCRHHGNYEWGNQPSIDAPVDATWFDFADFYQEVIDAVPDNGTMVEVGCWKGASLSFLLTKARASGKILSIYGVDHFKGSPQEPAMVEEARTTDIREIFHRTCDIAEYPYMLIQRPSVDAAKRFGNSSVDCVFLDASHDMVNVEQDLEAWLPKVKPGGILAGHDYDERTNPDVFETVNRVLGSVRTQGRCWVYRVGG